MYVSTSQVPGNDIDEFMRSEDELSEMLETAEMMPGIDPLGMCLGWHVMKGLVI